MRSVVGSDYRPEPERLHGLKQQIAKDTEPSIPFRDIHVLQHAQGRVVLFEIPPAPRGIPIAWKGHYFARAGESRTPLGLDKLDEIRQQTLAMDWTAQIIPGATLGDLDEAAVRKARESFAQKYANRITLDDVMGWPLATFLDRAHVTQNGQVTRTTLLLLGRAESAYRLSPHPAQMTWSLEGSERAYEHFGPPFLLNTTQLYLRIRNVQLRILPQDELLPVEVSKYDQKIVLEALHNCIVQELVYQLTDCSFLINGLKHTYSFQKIGNQTKVQQVMEYTVKFGLLGLLMDKMMIGKQFNSGICKFLTGLKTYAEK